MRPATRSSAGSGCTSDRAEVATYSSIGTSRTTTADPSRTCTRRVFGAADRATPEGNVTCTGPPAQPAASVRIAMPRARRTFSTISTSYYRLFSGIHLASVPRILVIDDDQGVRDSMARMLRGAGFNVEIATTGEEGVAAAKGNAFDVILSDMRMPGISGIEVLQKLREQRVDCAFIVMTGFGTVDTAVEAMKLGAVDFVQKPFLREELLIRVRSAAERRGLARQVDLLQRQIRASGPVDTLIGESEPMRKVKDLIGRAAAAPGTVLVT